MNGFEDALALDVTSLRALLGDGDPQERTWAAWALGLKLGGAFASDATARSRREPDPGVRRQLIVVMAGLGEAAAIRVIATSDPDPYVRATAHRYLFQTLGSDAVANLVAAATSDASEVVREEALNVLEARWPASRRGDLLALLDDRAPAVRQAAADRLAEVSLSAVELAAVIDRILDGADADLQRRLVAIVVASGATDSLAARMQDLSVDRLITLMDLVHAAGARMTWQHLAGIAARGVPALDRRALRSLPSVADADLAWLAGSAVRPYSWPRARTRAEVDVAEDVRATGVVARLALFAKIADLDPLPPDAKERRLFVALLDVVRTEEADVRANEYDPDEDDYWDPALVTKLEVQRRTLEFFLGQTERGD